MEARTRFVEALDGFFKSTFPGWLNNPNLTSDAKGLSVRDSSLRLNVTASFLVPLDDQNQDVPWPEYHSIRDSNWIRAINHEPQLCEWTREIIENRIKLSKFAIDELRQLKAKFND